MKQKINTIIISGPTATGKTALGIELAQKHSGEIVSADSRQVYKGFDIGTGKTMTASATVPIWGYDLFDPQESSSVSQFVHFAKETLRSISARGKLPFLVGGTGLYIRSLVRGFTDVHVPPNQKLRDELSHVSQNDLFQKLQQEYPDAANQLNDSDRQNPIRIIRAFEKALYKKAEKPIPATDSYEYLWIGLTAPKEFLDARIEQAVERRLEAGFEKEVRTLMNDIPLDSQAFSSTGYRQFIPYIQGKVSREEAISEWILAEKQYVKRQLTWFKKEPEIKWFDISDSSYKAQVAETVETWHNKVCLEK